jgi:4-carboxymuconolactone decarboxylase
MTDRQAVSGGRLPLLARADLNGAQARLWERMAETFLRWSNRAGFVATSEDGRYVGPFNPMLYSPEIAMSFLQLQLEEGRCTSLDERLRQVVIPPIGSIWKADYELYAHSAAARAAGFSGPTIKALCVGQPSPELSGTEGVAQRFALALHRNHSVDDGLYGAARSALGEKGIVDLVLLAGCCQLVCGMLGAFAVPAPPAPQQPKE